MISCPLLQWARLRGLPSVHTRSPFPLMELLCSDGLLTSSYTLFRGLPDLWCGKDEWLRRFQSLKDNKITFHESESATPSIEMSKDG